MPLFPTRVFRSIAPPPLLVPALSRPALALLAAGMLFAAGLLCAAGRGAVREPRRWESDGSFVSVHGSNTARNDFIRRATMPRTQPMHVIFPA